MIELMIVVAIIGLLAAIAVPAYQNYTVRARVVEGLSLASAAQIAVAETTNAKHALPATQAETGYVSPPATTNVASIVIADTTGIITITFTPAAGDGTIEIVPTLAANGDITWDCTQGTLLDKYRPANCR